MRFEHTILWHVLPLQATGAERTAAEADGVRHRLPRLLPWLDRVVELGANGLQLGPVFASETHGYDTTDHFRIDPRLGDDADFDRLVAEAHGRGVQVVLDGVFNHVGRSFERFRAAEAGDPEAARWFRREGDGWAVFEGHGHLVALDHDEPAVAEHVIAVLRHWLDRGVDGWRLDAAYAVPTAFWRTVAAAIRESHPHAFLYGEVIHGDYAAFAAESGLDSVTQYELWKAVWSSLNDANLFELSHALTRHAALVDAFVPMTFVGNHDVTRIASRLTDRHHLEHAVVLLATLPGHPLVYAGDEVGLEGVKEEREGGDDAIRPVLPDAPADQPGDPAVLALHQRMIALRRRLPWLVDGRLEVLETANTRLRFRVARRDGAEAVEVVLDLDGGQIDGAALEAGRGWAVLRA
ncbi:alpha-amylase family glycosyl hydrolase [Amnibacterium endophyticum]|uniref:Alpha-amylase family glycosyl hydrolase n=1 Tax=Amnibacterium endophyticum TaxID=2109337 RepID=A0ABW4LGA4_9MICO